MNIELNYKLSDKDFSVCAKELIKECSRFFIFSDITSISYDLLLVELISFLVVVYVFKDDCFLFLFSSILSFLFIVSLKFFHIGLSLNLRIANNFVFLNDKEYKLVLTEENMNIYTEKIVLSLHSLSIFKRIETKSYYILMAHSWITNYIIIPKSSFNSVEQLNEFLKFFSKTENNTRKLVSENMSYSTILSNLISAILIFVIGFLITPVPKSEYSISLYSYPVVKVKNNSISKKVGVDTGDIILRVNDVNTCNYFLPFIAKKISFSDSVKLTIKKNSSSEIKEYFLDKNN